MSFQDESLEQKIHLVPKGPLYEIPQSPPIQLERPSVHVAPFAEFAGGIDLTKAVLETEGDPGSRLFTLDLVWSRKAKSVPDFWVELHLWDGTKSRLLDLFPPAYGFYPPNQWKPGELVHEKDTFVLPTDVAPGQYELLIVLKPESSVKQLQQTQAPQPPDTLYSVLNPFSQRYGGRVGAGGRFQEIVADSPAKADEVLAPLHHRDLWVSLNEGLEVEPDPVAFFLGPHERGSLKVIPAKKVSQ